MTAESVAWENDLYTHRDQEGVLDDSLEQLFATEIEGPFLAIRNRLLSDPAQWLDGPVTSFSQQERHTVAMYLAIQHLRTPTERDGANWLSDLAAVNIVRDVMSPGGQGRPFFEGLAARQLSDDDIAELTRLLTDIASRNARERNHWLLVGMKLAPRLADLIAGLDWYLLVAPPHINLPTCDVPLVEVTRGIEPGSFELGGGWGQEGFEATLTISPSVALYLTHHVEDSGFLRTEAFAQSVRRRTVAHAREWVYSRSLDDDLGCLLASSPRPCHRIEFDGQVRTSSEAPGSLEAELSERGADQFRFRYG
jgi:hypothetical protein